MNINKKRQWLKPPMKIGQALRSGKPLHPPKINRAS